MWQEFSAKNIEEALDFACDKFQVASSELEYEVIEEGSNGLLGLFSKPAKIKARVKSEDSKTSEMKTAEVKPAVIKKAPVKTEVKEEVKKVAEKVEEVKQEVKTEVPVDVEAMKKTAEAFLDKVCKNMGINATFESVCNQEENRLDINIIGEDMGLLIGKRGQTLDSLQYLTGLVVNKESGTYFKVKLDTENYRARRKETLENLAKNICSKVKKTRKSVALEPMNPYERRIIHSALQNDKMVETYSEGEEPNRKVVIAIKKEYRNRNKGGYKKYNRNYKKGGYNRGGYDKRRYQKNDSKPAVETAGSDAE